MKAFPSAERRLRVPEQTNFVSRRIGFREFAFAKMLSDKKLDQEHVHRSRQGTVRIPTQPSDNRDDIANRIVTASAKHFVDNDRSENR